VKVELSESIHQFLSTLPKHNMAPIDVPSFADKQLKLLAAELNAELEETALLTATHAPSTLARAGLAVVNLAVSAQRTGMGGKSLVELSLDPAIAGTDTQLPEHGLRVGDIVGVSEQPRGAEKKKERQDMEKKRIQGVVVKVLREIIIVALDKDEVDIPGGKLWLFVISVCSSWRRVLLADRSCFSIVLSSQMTLHIRGIAIIPRLKSFRD
jgi:DNA polymerase alpha-associated DNA helicase A